MLLAYVGPTNIQVHVRCTAADIPVTAIGTATDTSGLIDGHT